MQEDYAKELLRSGIIEAKAGSKESARRYLDRAIYMSGSHDVLAEAWFWMGEIATDPVEKRKALENCLPTTCVIRGRGVRWQFWMANSKRMKWSIPTNCPPFPMDRASRMLTDSCVRSAADGCRLHLTVRLLFAIIAHADR